jgi:hypothetical protein
MYAQWFYSVEKPTGKTIHSLYMCAAHQKRHASRLHNPAMRSSTPFIVNRRNPLPHFNIQIRSKIRSNTTNNMTRSFIRQNPEDADCHSSEDSIF